MRRLDIRYSFAAVAIALLLAISLSTSSAQAQAEGPIYIVQPGDTLSAIALTFGVTVDALAEANAILDPSSIFPGQELIIPGFSGLEGVLGTRTIEFGETLTSASMRDGLPDATLARLNRIVNPARLVVGSQLILPESSPSAGKMELSQRLWIPESLGLLELAARYQLDPWSLATSNRLSERMWLVPNELVYVVASEGRTDALPPPIDQVEVLRLPAIQGRTVVIEVNLAEAGSLGVGGQLGPQPLNLIPRSSNSYRALQGIHALTEPAVIDLLLEVTEVGTGEVLDRFSQPLQVFDGDYGLEALQVPPETLDPEITGPEDDLIASVVGTASPDRMWQGAFQFPTSYYETFPSFFGTRRSYNGSGYIYYHTGLDLFGSTSTPVMAPANGVVAFADFLTVRGNVTYIDHGWGVYSGFLHQSEILVEVGQRVQRGDLIGYVGGTGRVTGPHLHWEIWVGGVPVDPFEWTAGEIPEG